MRNYTVKVVKKALKNLRKMPVKQQAIFDLLIEDLEATGPVQKEWANYSKLGKDEHHCHLSRKWVAVWRYYKEEILVEVTYVGSRENAPYDR